nr:hypothetical protein CFP56_38793 [Quercus suber]
MITMLAFPPPKSCPSHFRQEIALFTIASPWLGSRDVRADVRRSRSVQMQCHDSIKPSCRVRGAIALSLEGTVSIMGIIANGVSLARSSRSTYPPRSHPNAHVTHAGPALQLFGSAAASRTLKLRVR